MTKFKAKNEKIKRRYLQWLQDAQGYSVKTIYEVEKALWKFESFAKEDDYATFNQKQAKDFKTWLARQAHKGKALSLASQYQYLRHIKSFFLWLSGQPGYKSRVSSFDVQLLKLDKQQSRIATSIRPMKYPSLFYVKKLCESIQINTELDQRDRALISFHFLSGMRVAAIYTLPLKCFNPRTLEVFQFPKEGVKTKFSKQIMTTLFRFDEELLGYILEWVDILRRIKLFDDAAPMFPRTKTTHHSEHDLSFEGREVEPVFWKVENAILKIFEKRASTAGLEYFSPHKFRHAAIAEARKFCRTEEQRKAVSQNVGHEHVGTTFSYGNMDTGRVNEIVSKMNFKNTDAQIESLKSVSTEALLKEIQLRASI